MNAPPATSSNLSGLVAEERRSFLRDHPRSVGSGWAEAKVWRIDRLAAAVADFADRLDGATV